MWFHSNNEFNESWNPNVSPSPKANEPYFKILRNKADYQTNNENLPRSDTMILNPIYLMTQSSSEKTKIHKIKVPITRQPVKDFNSTYLSPKMWPTSHNRLKASRGSMFPIYDKTLRIANFNTNNSFNQNEDRYILGDSKTLTEGGELPLIFADKQIYTTNSSQRLRPSKSIGYTDIKLSTRMKDNFKQKELRTRTCTKLNKSKSESGIQHREKTQRNSTKKNITKTQRFHKDAKERKGSCAIDSEIEYRPIQICKSQIVTPDSEISRKYYLELENHKQTKKNLK